MNCLIIEDEYLAAKVVEDYIHQTEGLKLIAACEDAESAVSVLKQERIDLLFLDINLPNINGLDFIKSLQEIPQFIFVTAYHEYALEGFELNAVDYLLKPIEYLRFLKAIDKAREKLKYKSIEASTMQQADSFFIKHNGKVEKIMLNDILYIEALHNYLAIVTIEKKYIVYSSVKKILEELPSHLFVRIHKSYVVPIAKVQRMEHNHVVIESKVIPVSRSLKKEVLGLILNKQPMMA